MSFIQTPGGLNVLQQDMPAYQAQGGTPTTPQMNWLPAIQMGMQYMNMMNRPQQQMPQMPMMGGGMSPQIGGWSPSQQQRFKSPMSQGMGQTPGQGGLFGYLGGS